MKLILLSMLATVVAAVSLAAVAQSAPTAQTVRVTEKSFSIALLGQAEGRRGEVRRQERVRRRPRPVASRRRQDLEDPRDRRSTLQHPGRHTQEGRPLHFWCGVGAHRSAGMQGSFVAR